MSRSSPGRYSLHDFAKNVYDVHAFAADGRELPTTRPDPYGWNVDRPRRQRDGEVQGVRRSRRRHLPRRRHDARAHQHAGGDHVGARARRSAGRGHLRAAGRARTGRSRRSCIRDRSPLEFTAPNLQYLMDSPSEFGPVAIRAVHGRLAARSASRCTTPAPTPSSTRYVKDVEKIVRQEGAIYGEYPEYEPGHYTFLADYLPYAERRRHGASQQHGDHRRPGRLRAARDAICSTPSRTSSSTAGTSSASGRRGSSRSTSIARTCPASCGSPKGSRSTTVR